MWHEKIVGTHQHTKQIESLLAILKRRLMRYEKSNASRVGKVEKSARFMKYAGRLSPHTSMAKRRIANTDCLMTMA